MKVDEGLFMKVFSMSYSHLKHFGYFGYWCKYKIEVHNVNVTSFWKLRFLGVEPLKGPDFQNNLKIKPL